METAGIKESIIQASIELVSIIPGIDQSMLESPEIAGMLPFVLIGLSFSLGGVIACLISLKNQGTPTGDALSDMVNRGKTKVLNPLLHVVFEDTPKDPRAVARNSIGSMMHAQAQASLEQEEPLDLDAARRAKSKFGKFGRHRKDKKGKAA